MREFIEAEFHAHEETFNKTRNQLLKLIEETASLCISSLRASGKILLCGNGGSAADAQHIAAELVGRYRKDRPGMAAIALTTDSSILTSVSNDYGYDHVFSRQVEGLAKQGDVLIAISTSGNSPNVLNAIKTARDKGCKVVGFTGNDGGKMQSACDLNLVVPARDTARIQEMHILIGHTLCGLIEENC